MTQHNNFGKHALRIVIGGVAGLGAIYIDNAAAQIERPLLQMALWTFILFAYSITELQSSIRRRAQFYIALALCGLHFLFLVLMRNIFPFQNSLFIFAGALPEGLVLVSLYARVGQALDPTGPFGLTEKEQRDGAARH